MSATDPRILRGRRILVVEDEPTIRRFYERLFATHSMEIVFAPTGNVAMEVLESGQTFDVILLDVRLPGLSGREIWKLMEIKRPDLCSKVILVTGDILSDATRRLLKDSGRPYLEKPFSTEELLKAMIGVVNRPAGGTGGRGQSMSG